MADASAALTFADKAEMYSELAKNLAQKANTNRVEAAKRYAAAGVQSAWAGTVPASTSFAMISAKNALTRMSTGADRANTAARGAADAARLASVAREKAYVAVTAIGNPHNRKVDISWTRRKTILTNGHKRRTSVP